MRLLLFLLSTGIGYLVFDQGKLPRAPFLQPQVEITVYMCSNGDTVLYAGSNDNQKTYHWQYAASGPFNSIEDNDHYAGTKTPYLTIQQPPSAWYGYRYRCVITYANNDDLSDVYLVKFSNTWTGAADTLWENPSNWNCASVPDCNTDVIIPAGLSQYPSIHSSLFCKSVQLQNNGRMTITPNQSLSIGKITGSISCPGNSTIQLPPGSCDTVVIYNLTTTGACNGTLLQTSGLISGAAFPIGTTTNCYQYQSPANVVLGTCCFDVTVIKPQLICPPDIQTCCLNELSPAYTGAVSAADFCEPVTIVYSDSIVPGDLITVLYYIYRTWTVTDGGGNSSACQQIISVLPNVQQILCPGNMIVGVDPMQSEAVVTYTVGMTCTCSDSIIQTAGLASGDTFPLGLTTNCFFLLDSAGAAIDSCCFDVEVVHACLESSVYFERQGQIDSFPINHPGCTHILSTVSISDGGTGQITNLDSLIQLHYVSALYLFSNYALSDLHGLDSIKSIGGNFLLQDNPVLENVSGLDALTSVQGYLIISNHQMLSSFTGLGKLRHVGDYLDLHDNPAIVNFSGLDSLHSIGTYLNISNNPSLQNFSGLGSLQTVADFLQINNNDSLQHLTGLAGLVQAGSLFISDNDLLADMTGLEGLTQLNGSLVLIYNPVLNNLNGLNALTTINGSLQISNSPALQSLQAMANLTALNGQLILENNAALTSLNGLGNINPASLTYLLLINSQNLSVCDVESICTYLSDPANEAFIEGNATGCSTRPEVEMACGL